MNVSIGDVVVVVYNLYVGVNMRFVIFEDGEKFFDIFCRFILFLVCEFKLEVDEFLNFIERLGFEEYRYLFFFEIYVLVFG